MLKKLIATATLLTLTACASVVENKNPLAQTFPTITGNNLNKQQVTLPADLDGDLNVIIVGYVQDAQFDIDRWLIGLDMTQTKVTAYELPTISGMFPRMFETFIDNGMRKGIPKALWGGVITVYDDADKITELTGTENPRNARVMLLDEQGKILYFYDGGFAVAALNELRDVIDAKRR